MPLHAPIEHTAASPERQLDALLSTVGVSPLEAVGWIRATGEDRVRWLNGMVTNSIQTLKAGEGNYSFALNAQGQIQGDLTTFAVEDALLLQTARDRVPAMIAMFDRFIIMDDVELEDISPTRRGLQVAGPHASDLLTQIGLSAPNPASENTLSIASLPWRDNATVQVIAAHSPLVPRFELWTGDSTHETLQAELERAASILHGGPVQDKAIQHLRILEGTPRYGTDILQKHLAQETDQARALHFAKGCYLGQEIVERIRSRGNVHRAFTAFRLEGPLPASGTTLSADGKPIAELTSVAAIPFATGPLQIALGIARREPVERAALITYITENGPGVAVPVNIPIDIPIDMPIDMPIHPQ